MRVVSQDFVDNRFGFCDIVIIGDVEFHLDTTNWVVAVVDDFLAPDFTVGDDDLCLRHYQSDRLHRRNRQLCKDGRS